VAIRTKPRAYIDAGCFTEAAAFDVGCHKPERKRDIDFLRGLFSAAFSEEVELYTSSLSVAECQFVRGDEKDAPRILTDEVKQAFREMLTSGQFVVLVQDSILIGEQARDILWVHGISIRGADAIHIASAVSAGCEEFITFDEKSIGNRADQLREKFGLKVIPPRESQIVPRSKHPDAGPLFTAEAEQAIAEAQRVASAGDAAGTEETE
jgi:predicted nucleic acid-binding protein